MVFLGFNLLVIVGYCGLGWLLRCRLVLLNLVVMVLFGFGLCLLVGVFSCSCWYELVVFVWD